MSTSIDVALSGAQLVIEGYAPTVWQHANLAQHWYLDTQREAQGSDGEHSTRREIVFACCFLETYIFEWVRDNWFEHINVYFPPGKITGLKDKWQSVLLALHKEGRIPATSIDTSKLGMLVLYRNGLIHARASRPATSGQPKDETPIPALGQLANIPNGWALRVAKELVQQLHAQTGTSAPAYL